MKGEHDRTVLYKVINMKELIKVETNEQGQKLVSGRELHKVLKVQKPFTDWIPVQLKNVDAIEGEDYTKVHFKVTLSKTGQTSHDYILTLDIAKEICMCVGVAPRTNEETRSLSKQVRRYFIECEKQLTQVKMDSYMIVNPIERAKRWIEEEEERQRLALEVKEKQKVIEHQEIIIEEQKPCVDYVEAVSAQKDSILVRQVCKIAFTKGHIEIGERKLYNLLRHWKLICLHSTEPTQKALNSDYLEVETKLIDTMYGKKEVFTTLVKPKGQVYIVQRLANLTIDEVNAINKEINEKRR